MSENDREARRERPPRGPRGRGVPGEKPKDLKTAIKKLVYYLKGYKLLIILASICSILSSIFLIIGPDKLKDLTNEISNSLIVNKDNYSLILKDIEKC